MRPRLSPITKSLRPLLRTIEVTDSELIVIQAALQYYRDFVCAAHPDLYQQVNASVSSLVNRLHDQLPPRKDRIEGQ
jgi:hypothetical protein